MKDFRSDTMRPMPGDVFFPVDSEQSGIVLIDEVKKGFVYYRVAGEKMETLFMLRMQISDWQTVAPVKLKGTEFTHDTVF